ncbi:MAG: hypothetical protein US52_C0008G0022 [candidate division WS6 bacterium GW2011_GWA2_37_6]|uniref:Mannosyl-glycoprotein endo-beta-N-acetylglucosamidase-like domain-containing protein n=1 Tax=candidate division WS6 bacterium GW2011_GWA2_37_6 TaxID=1619087 RepID=A0A0G0GYW4_9BACT|nr:MAG: hypothetical protein US52_C0008G0022 [candidate division WS6 bacterium GW2011_GWA2_37_6]
MCEKHNILTRNIKGTYLFAKTYPLIFLRITLVFFITLSVIAYLSVNVLASGQTTSSKSFLSGQEDVLTKNDEPVISEIQAPVYEEVKIAEKRKVDEEQRLAEVQKKLAIRQDHINRINNFLIRKRSPVANTNIAEILYDLSVQYGGDYKTLLAITGVESGFCAASFSYNCFGFLNGKKYGSYEQAFRDIVPKVIKNYLHRYGSTNFVSIAKSYGMVNWEKGSSNLAMYYSQV